MRINVPEVVFEQVVGTPREISAFVFTSMSSRSPDDPPLVFGLLNEAAIKTVRSIALTALGHDTTGRQRRELEALVRTLDDLLKQIADRRRELGFAT